jgi:hypothetical protein
MTIENVIPRGGLLFSLITAPCRQIVRSAAASLSPVPPQKKSREKYGLATSLVDDFNKQVLLHLPNMELVEALSPFHYRIWLFQTLCYAGYCGKQNPEGEE